MKNEAKHDRTQTEIKRLEAREVKSGITKMKLQLINPLKRAAASTSRAESSRWNLWKNNKINKHFAIKWMARGELINGN